MWVINFIFDLDNFVSIIILARQLFMESDVPAIKLEFFIMFSFKVVNILCLDLSLYFLLLILKDREIDLNINMNNNILFHLYMFF